MFEQLEARQLLSAVLENGTLTINGTDEADTITLEERVITTSAPTTGSDWIFDNWAKIEYVLIAKVNGVEQRFSYDDVQQVVINGLGGDDTIGGPERMYLISPVAGGHDGSGRGFSQFIYGGDGNDTIIGGMGNDSIDGGNGNDVIYDVVGRNTLIGGDGVDEITGGSGPDTLIGSAVNDLLNGGGGSDQFFGETGQLPSAVLENGTLTINGTDGADSIVVEERFATITGTSTDPGGILVHRLEHVLIAKINGVEQRFSYDDVQRIVINGLGGNDTINSVQTMDVAFNGSPTGLPQSICGGDGNDTITGGRGNDSIDGGNGNDVIRGGEGNDRLSGGFGDDILMGGGGADVLSGGEGVDMVDYSDHAQGVAVTLDGRRNDGSRRERDWVKADVESILGSKYDDVLTGNSGNNYLFGGAGNDTLLGGAGNDTLEGGLGGDWMDGGAGNDQFSNAHTESDKDTVIGGRGRDRAWSEQEDLLTGIEDINGRRR